MRSRIVLTGCLLVVSVPGIAQQTGAPATVDSGVVVRGWMGDSQLRGRLLEPLRTGADSMLYCRYPGPPCGRNPDPSQIGWLRPGALDHLDRQVGTRAKRGAVIGTVGGFVLGFVGATFAGAFCEYDCDTGRETAFKVLLSGAFGGSLGALIGSAFPRMERVF